MSGRGSPLVRVAVIGALVVSIACAAAGSGDDLLFRDSFEQRLASCVSGPPVSGAAAGDLGPAPAGSYTFLTCIEIRNDRDFERGTEIAWAGIPVPRDWQLRDADLARLALIGPGNRRLRAQFEIVSRWGGPLSDASLPIRWLEVAVQPRVPAQGHVAYALRRYDTAPTPVTSLDPFAVSLASDGAEWVVDTGLATIGLDPNNPALIHSIAADPDDDGAGPQSGVYAHVPGAGPELRFDNGTAVVTLSTEDPGEVAVDVGGFAIERSGPVRAVVTLRGHFASSDGSSRCTSAGTDPYEAFGFTLTATFNRASRDVLLGWNIRNECSNALFPPWTDETARWESVRWRLPLAALAPSELLVADDSGVQALSADSVSTAAVEQRKGAFDGIGNWQRRAETRVDGNATNTAATYELPMVGAAGADFVATLQMPSMRYREPQSLAADTALVFAPVSRPLTVGEGKGIWSRALLRIRPRGGDIEAQVDTMGRAGAAALERGLLPRLPRTTVNQAGHFPSLGDASASSVKTAYLRYINEQHDNTVRAGATGQWARAKTYGSQLWPDTQANDLFEFPGELAPEPAANSGAMNYWNPSGAELLEFLRSGEPRWVWDFAQPQAWLQLFTARLNIGARSHGSRNGVAVTSGGTGEGQWHRSGSGSDDYTYNAGMHLHYAVRPLPSMRARFRHGGRMVRERYSVPWDPDADPCDPGPCDPGQLITQDNRDIFLNAVMPVRGNFQHFELLANCAEFVPGSAGELCHQRLDAIMAEIANDNLRAGLLCQDDVPVDDFCDMPQTFMTNAMMYRFLLRYYNNYGDRSNLAGQPTLSRTLGELMATFYAQGMEQRADGGPDAAGDWAYAMGCQLVAGGSAVGTCTWFDTGDGLAMFPANKPHTVALGLIGDAIDPDAGLCADSRRLLDELFAGLDPVSNPYGPLGSFADGGGGWWKGSSQAAQMLVFALGGYANCTE